MAVCGRCYLCGRKFECVKGIACESCAEDVGCQGPVWLTYKEGETGRKICGGCIDALNETSIGQAVAGLLNYHHERKEDDR